MAVSKQTSSRTTNPQIDVSASLNYVRFLTVWKVDDANYELVS